MYTFSKKEKLTGKIAVNMLFCKGKGFISFPLRVVVQTMERNEEKQEAPVRVLIVVPKKRRKHAVDRNLLKRRIREAYRLNKLGLVEEISRGNKNIRVAFQYVANENLSYNEIEGAMRKAIWKIKEKY
ncbi:MAG: ribonuclease P protein component [Paludibacteraceae bacterium]|nr:ribonuclease P protein component [Paludibacteraceae bacterium]